MTAQPDWLVWLLALALLILFGWYFSHVARVLWRTTRQLILTIQHWPEIRRQMVEAEVRAGGRYPLWYRALRVTSLLALTALVLVLIYRKFVAMD